MASHGRQAAAFLIGTLCAVICLSSQASALDVPPLTGRVVDLAHVLPPATIADLSARLQAHEDQSSNQVAVLIIPSLEGEPLFDYSHRVATTWKLGQKDIDNGALLLVAIKDRKVRIEVGYGLEGTLTDARSAQIIRHEIVPQFRAGDFAAGVSAGVDAILKTIQGTYRAPERRPATVPSGERLGEVLFAIVIGVVIGLALSRAHRFLGAAAGGGISFLAAPWLVPALLAGAASLIVVGLIGSIVRSSGGWRSGRGWSDPWVTYSSRGGWGHGGFGGSFDSIGGFSGGGGNFGGGGASGDW